ncbi:hypothetical protein GCM10010341_76710 [Streptomyces noursei]|nr:hypothetical protein GCM10010341_76710 [Streptomyces noursei]
MHPDVRDNRSVTAVAPLHQALPEQPGRADTETQRRGKRAMVFRLLRGPRIQNAKRQEDGSSETSGSESGIRQTGLLRPTGKWIT